MRKNSTLFRGLSIAALVAFSAASMNAATATVDADFKGFDYDNAHNLWKSATLSLSNVFFANNDWVEIAAPEISLAGNTISLTTPADMGYSQWQGQVAVNTGIEVSTANTYSFSCNVNVDKEATITMKLYLDDNTFFIGSPVTIPAGGACVYFNNVNGAFNGPMKFLVDLAGYPSTEFTFSDICFLESQYVEVETPEEEEFTGYDYNSPANLWKSADVEVAETYFATDSWNEIAAPAITLTNEKLSLTTPAQMGYTQWQGQVKIGTDIAVSAEQSYDFCCYIDAPVETRITVKVQDAGENGNGTYIEVANPVIPANGGWYHFSNLKGFNGTLWVTFDFAGYPDTEFNISNFVFGVSGDFETGVKGIENSENGVFTVYSLTGAPVMTTADSSRINTLPRGIYIANGKKFVVR